MNPHRHVARVLTAAAAVAIAIAIAMASPARAQAPAPSLLDSLRWDPAVHRGVLPNGIRWFVKRNAKPEARVSLRLVVPVGSTAEADDQQGLAHFVEHMNFNGSAHFKDADELVGYLRSVGLRFGADANAGTSFDETTYMLDVPTDRDSALRTGFDALSDFAGRAFVSDREVDKERGVIMEEWRLGRGAEERIQRQQFPVLFHDSRYAVRLPIGKPEIIQHAPPQRIRDFYRDWYRPEWMAVVVVGDLDPDKAEALVREHFSDLPKRTDSRDVPRWDVPGHDSTYVSIVTDKEATSSSVEIVCTRPRRSGTTVGVERGHVVAELFSAMLNARLDEIAHRADPPFLGAGAGGGQFTRGTEIYAVNAEVKDGAEARALQALLEETARVRAHGFLASELDRAKRERQAALEKQYAERDRTESPRLAYAMVRAFLNDEPSTGIGAGSTLDLALLPGVTLAEVNALADTLVSTRNRVVLMDGPEKPGVTMPGEADVRATLAREAAASPPAWVDHAAGLKLMARLPVAGKVKSRRTLDSLGVTVVTFGNGVEVWLKPTDFKADEIQFSAYAPGGLAATDSADFVTAWMGPVVVSDNGIGGFKAPDLQKLLAGHIASVYPGSSAYTNTLRGNTRPEDLETALQLIHLTMTAPTEDPAGYAALEQRLAAVLANRANSPEQVYSDSATSLTTGGLWLYKVPTAGQVAAVKLPEALAAYRKAYANAADYTFFFAGNFGVDSIVPLLARYVGSLPSAGRRTAVLVPRGPRYPDGITQAVVRKGVEPKGNVRITFYTRRPPDELDQHRANSAASILNDHLRSSLRELLGGTYSPSVRFSTFAPVPGYTTMTIAFGCDPARADTLVSAALAEVKRLAAEGPTAEDVSKEQEVQRRELETSLKTNGWWIGSLQSVHMMGWDPMRITKRRERIGLLTPGNVQAAFRTYFPADHYSVIRLVPENAPAAP